VALGIVELELLDGERLAEPLQDCRAHLPRARLVLRRSSRRRPD
jgi:hypothetical protein